MRQLGALKLPAYVDLSRNRVWVSNVVHVYLWEGSGFNDMAKKMSEAKVVLHANL